MHQFGGLTRLEQVASTILAGMITGTDVARAVDLAEEVLAEVRREWDGFNTGFAWLTSMLPADVQARAFDHRGGPSAARRPTMATALAAGLLGLYVLSFLPGGPAADPLAPVLGTTAVLLLADAVRRIRATRRGRYAPSLFRWLLPSDSLRPERLAWHEHRDAERETLDELVRPAAPAF